MPPLTIRKWTPVEDLPSMMRLAALVMVVDLLESTSIARWAGRLVACARASARASFCASARADTAGTQTHPRILHRRALARKNGYRLSYNREIIGLGLANFAGAMFNCYTTTGSFSRSAVNNASGAGCVGRGRGCLC